MLKNIFKPLMISVDVKLWLHQHTTNPNTRNITINHVITSPQNFFLHNHHRLRAKLKLEHISNNFVVVRHCVHIDHSSETQYASMSIQLNCKLRKIFDELIVISCKTKDATNVSSLSKPSMSGFFHFSLKLEFTVNVEHMI